jgi:hypothetical protein
VESFTTGESFKEELIRRLDIPRELVGKGNVGLLIGYKKYEAFLAGWNKFTTMKNSGNWQGKKPTQTDVAEIFSSRSFFHSHYRKHFSYWKMFTL